MVRPGDLLARAFARFVARSPGERLERLASGPLRRSVLNAIFRQMPRRFVKEKAKDVDAVIDWRIKDSRGGEPDRYQVVIRSEKCRVTRHPSEPARTTLELGGVDFLRIAAGVVQGPELFMGGKLKIEGDLMFAAQLASLFRVPAPPNVP
jgi:putative sterol carrier protein